MHGEAAVESSAIAFKPRCDIGALEPGFCDERLAANTRPHFGRLPGAAREMPPFAVQIASGPVPLFDGGAGDEERRSGVDVALIARDDEPFFRGADSQRPDDIAREGFHPLTIGARDLQFETTASEGHTEIDGEPAQHRRIRDCDVCADFGSWTIKSADKNFPAQGRT